VAISAAEEESIEALKRWWRETGRTLAVGIAIVLLAYFGWQQWQAAQQRSAGAASALFDELSAITVGAPGERLGESAQQEALAMIEQLKSDYSNSVYAKYGALFAARIAVEADDLYSAEQQLQWVLDNARSSLFGFIGTATDETLLLTTRLRLARVQLAQGDTDRAESTISGIDPKALVAEYAELRGDIHYARGQRELALAAYMEAAETGADNPFLNMKINELATES